LDEQRTEPAGAGVPAPLADVALGLERAFTTGSLAETTDACRRWSRWSYCGEYTNELCPHHTPERPTDSPFRALLVEQ
jgi:hypothetical protein